jgi:hypothetical protein
MERRNFKFKVAATISATWQSGDLEYVTDYTPKSHAAHWNVSVIPVPDNDAVVIRDANRPAQRGWGPSIYHGSACHAGPRMAG